MTRVFGVTMAILALAAINSLVWAQEESAGPAETTTEAEAAQPSLEEQAQKTVEEAEATLDQVVEKVDANQQAQQVSTSILQPIYALAEKLSFPAFHWLAFAAMVAGVVSFALQLTLGKLVVLTKLGLSPTEIFSDALGLVVSLLGLVLTTQAAAENSTFTSSASAVISATCVGAIAGLVFYVWSQRQELQAVEGRKFAKRGKHDATPPESK